MSDEIQIPVPPAPIQTQPEQDNSDPTVAANWLKLLSGRFILTVVGAICFYKFSATLCKIMIAKQESIDSAVLISLLTNLIIVVSNIFTFYFVKKSMATPSNNGTDNE